jgi:hypothetical protein
MNHWAALMDSAGNQIGDELWCSVIRVVASHVLKSNGNLTDEVEEDEEAVEQLIKDWLYESIPTSSQLNWIIDDLGYFMMTLGLAWHETIGLTQAYSLSIDDVVWSLQLRYEERDYEITAARVIDFLVKWRFAFLCRIINESKKL